jgi:hypothetical protein
VPGPASASATTSATRVPAGSTTVPSATVNAVSSGGGIRSVTWNGTPPVTAPAAAANAPADQPPLPEPGGPLKRDGISMPETLSRGCDTKAFIHRTSAFTRHATPPAIASLTQFP